MTRALTPKNEQPRIDDDGIHRTNSCSQSSVCRVNVLNLKALQRTAPDLNVLSRNELKRATQFRHSQAHDHFIWGRWLLRTSLAHLLSVEPENIEIAIAETGRPYVKDLCANFLDFNLSHSGDYVILAIGHGCLVGIDIECAAETDDIDVLKPYVFGKNCKISSARQMIEGFSAKEAVLKMLGIGLVGGLHSVSLPHLPDPTSPYRAEIQTPEGLCWCLDIPLSGGVRAFLALNQSEVSVTYADHSRKQFGLMPEVS